MAAGRFDAGLVIHEARFTYPRYGLTALVDLGEWWEADTGLPIPLGAILARRGAVDPAAAAEWIRASVRQAWADPAASRDYVLAHAQEMELDVVDQHIDLYVNEFTEDLGEDGYAAVDALLDRRRRAGLAPSVPPGQISSSRATAWTSWATVCAVFLSGNRPRRRSGRIFASSTLIMSSIRPCSSSAGRRRSSATDGGASSSFTPQRLAALAAVGHAELDPLAAPEVGRHPPAAPPCARTRPRPRHW